MFQKIASIVITGVLLAQPVSAFSQGKTEAGKTMAGLKVAVVDIQSAILQTEQGKIAKSNIEKEAEDKRKELLNQQNDLKKLDEEFQKQQSVLSEDAKLSKQKEFQTKLQGLRTAQMSFEQEVRQKELQETQKIFQNLAKLVDEIAKKKKLDMVFEKGSGALLYAAKVDDLTEELVTEYNSKYKAGNDKVSKK
jgi:outer membrane protein